MIDNLYYQVKKLEKHDTSEFSTSKIKHESNGYAFLTLHRPSNVDYRNTFEQIASALNEIAEDRSILFPIHPRTKKMMAQFNIGLSDNIKMLSPFGV